jgi:nucleoside-diphosphate-sugar epimerase
VRIAVTGATGFIGRRLVHRHLEAGDSVRVLTRRSPAASGFPDAVQLFSGDLADRSADLSPFVDGADVLYHCAAELRETVQMRPVHVVGTQRLLRAAAGKIGRWVQLSSVGVYGGVKSGLITEAWPARPVGEYETTKWEAERLVARAVAEGLDAAVLRPSNVFAPEMKSRGLLRLTALIEERRFFFIGKAGAIANYIHVDNVVEALLLCATKQQACGATYNLSDWRTFEQFVSAAAEELGVPTPSWRIPQLVARGVAWSLGRVSNFPLTPARIDALVTRAIYDTSRIERDLGYRHAIGLEAALKQTIRAWHRGARGGAAAVVPA